MKRKPNYFEKGLKIAIVIVFIAIIAVVAINTFGPSSTEIQMLGVSLVVPDDGGFDSNSKYNVYSTYMGKNNEWFVTAINTANVNYTDSKQVDYLNEFNATKNSDMTYSEKTSNDGVPLYRTGSGVVAYFKVNSIDFKVSGSEDTVMSIINSIKDLNKGSSIVFN